MDSNEYRRLGAVEQRLAISEERDRVADERMDRMERQLNTLVAAFNMGRGGAIAAAKIGGFLVLLLTAGAWIYDHFLSPLIGKH